MKLIELGDKFMIAFLIMILSSVLLLIGMWKHEHVDAILALVGTWWGAIIAYYFSKRSKKEKKG